MDEKLNLLYDKEADVLYVSIGHPEYTEYMELDDNFILRLDPQTKEVVGFTVIDFAARFAQEEPPLTVPLRATFERTGKKQGARATAEKQVGYSTKRVKGVNGRRMEKRGRK